MRNPTRIEWLLLASVALAPWVQAQYAGDNLTNTFDGAASSTNLNSAAYLVGSNTHHDVLWVLNGAGLTNSGLNSGVGYAASASNNLAVVSGANSIWRGNGAAGVSFSVGYYGANNRLVVSNGGSVLFTNATVPNAYLGGNSNTANGNEIVVDGQGSSLMLNALIIGGDVSLAASAGSFHRLIVTNGGRVELKSGVSYVGRRAGSSNNVVIISGAGSVLSAQGSLLTSSGPGQLMLINDGGTLELTNMTWASNQGFTNSGGIIQFFTASPTLAFGTTAKILTNATVGFRGINNADVLGSLGSNSVSLFRFQGANTFRLNNASNTSAASPQNYTFASGISPSNYVGLEMINGGTAWKSAWLNIGAGGRMLVSNTSASVEGVTTNSGSITVLNASATWQSPVVNLGAWVSDPSTNAFNGSFTVGPTAYVSAASGDVYAFGGDFLMGSTNRAFSMASARVVFATNGFGLSTTTANHLLSISNSGALEIGAGYTNFSQVASNFALGSLSIESGDRLTVAGSKGGALTNALYVGWLDIRGGFDTNSYSAVTNALVLALNLPNVNLYYDTYDPRNGWLNANLVGDSANGYNLWSGGLLLPIPEPSALGTLAAGLALLGFLRRRACGEGR